MNQATLPPHPSPLGWSEHLLSRLGRGLRVTSAVLLSLRHAMGQRPAMQVMLREANLCEASDPRRSAALRQAAAHLLD